MPQADVQFLVGKIEEKITLEERALTLAEQGQKISIITPSDYTAAGEYVKRLDALLAEIDAGYDDNILAAHKLHKGLIAKKKKYYDPPNLSRTNVRKLMTDWDNAEEDKRRVEELRLQALARKVEEEAQLAAALEAEAAGETEEAEAIIQEPVYVPPVIVKKDVPKVAGVRFAVYWKHEVTNFSELVKAVAAGKAPINSLKPDDVFLGNQARALHEGFNIPGVRAYSEKR